MHHPDPICPRLGKGMAANDELWSFAFALFKTDDVESWCLDWQRRHDLDISFLLWAGWLEHICGLALTGNQVTNAFNTIADWRQNVILPIRRTRHYLEDTGFAAIDPEAYAKLRSHLRTAELAGERREQELLVAYTETQKFSAVDSERRQSNMTTYLASAGGMLNGENLQRTADMDRIAENLAGRVKL